MISSSPEGAEVEPESHRSRPPMTVVVTIQHPAHVHFFRNAIAELESRGHEVHVFARQKDIAIDLLEAYDIDYTVLAGRIESMRDLPVVQGKYELNLLRKAARLDPDLMMAIGEPGVAHVGTVLSCPSLLFADTETSKLQKRISVPFADRICTPDCYTLDHGHKQVRYPGYHELAYLHPDRFTSDPDVLTRIGATPEDSLVILRMVSWGAVHDIGDSGFGDIRSVIDRLEAKGARVLITAEDDLPPELDGYRIDAGPEQIHHLMAYADLFIGESATMATESAVLGTPAVFVSSSTRGYTDELESRYELVYNFSGENRQRRALETAEAILDRDRSVYESRRETMLEEKIDTTWFQLQQIEALCRA